MVEENASEQAVRQQLVRLCQAERDLAISEVASGMAHELNQPLTAITGFIDGSLNLLRDHGSVPERIMDALEKASDQAYRAGEIIRQIRDIINYSDIGRETVNICSLLEVAIAILKAEFVGSNIRIEAEYEDNLPTVRVNIGQIQTLCLALVRNSFEAIMASKNAEQRITIKVGLSGENDLRVQIGDDGIGIGDEEPFQLFAPFYTTKPNAIGMGLPVSRTIIEAHGGKIWFEKRAPSGMHFIFTLPLNGGEASGG